jgi:hypothetical protein
MLDLTEDRRARLRAFVQQSPEIPSEEKTRILGALDRAQVPARLVQRLETRMGG